MALSVLVVDDHPSLRRLLEMVAAEDPRFERVFAASGLAEALELAAKEYPQVVVLDADLRGEDGLNGIAPLRERVPGAAVVVFSSAPYASDDIAREAGADRFVEKGTDLDTLLDVLVEAAEERRHVVDLRDPVQVKQES
jgi:two-component system nitrate/nitrite response regulator NarP